MRFRQIAKSAAKSSRSIMARQMALVAAMVLSAGSVASAATIKFTTSGLAPIDLGGGVMLSFTGSTSTYDTSALPITNNSVDYGTFTVTGLTSSFVPDSTIDYSITITEELPGPGDGPAVVTGTISGMIQINTSWLQWTPDSPGIASISYVPAVDNVTTVFFQLNPTNIGNGVVTTGTIHGNLEVATTSGAPLVPVPAAAWGGMGLIGVLGGVRAIRRRFQAE